MATVIFVHGTGVRKAGYDAALAEIDKRLNTSLRAIGRAPVRVEGCLWGDSLGSKPALLSIPEYRRSGGKRTGMEAREHDEALLWEMLRIDPLFELRGLALEPQGQDMPLDIRKFRRKLEALLTNPALQAPLDEAGLAATFEEGVKLVLDEGELDRVLDAAASAGQCRLPVARAIVAAALDRAEAEPPPLAATSQKTCDALVEAVANAIGPPDMAPPAEWAVNALFETAKFLGVMHLVRRRRGKLTDFAAAPTADILLYQARGARIRRAIRDTIRKVKPEDHPVVLLAHSLGGVACVDLLVIESQPEVKLLVTVGSQAPFLYECNALRSLRKGDALPRTFVRRWLNLYDPRDFLSYAGRDVFPATPGGPPQVADRMVDNGLAFPDSHSGYWGNEQTWATIAPEIPSS